MLDFASSEDSSPNTLHIKGVPRFEFLTWFHLKLSQFVSPQRYSVNFSSNLRHIFWMGSVMSVLGAKIDSVAEAELKFTCPQAIKSVMEIGPKNRNNDMSLILYEAL